MYKNVKKLQTTYFKDIYDIEYSCASSYKIIEEQIKRYIPKLKIKSYEIRDAEPEVSRIEFRNKEIKDNFIIFTNNFNWFKYYKIKDLNFNWIKLNKKEENKKYSKNIEISWFKDKIYLTIEKRFRIKGLKGEFELVKSFENNIKTVHLIRLYDIPLKYKCMFFKIDVLNQEIKQDDEILNSSSKINFYHDHYLYFLLQNLKKEMEEKGLNDIEVFKLIDNKYN